MSSSTIVHLSRKKTREPLPCVTWRPIACPECSSTEKTTDGVRKNGVRRHTCLGCGTRFASRPED